MTRPALSYDYTCFADGVLHLKKRFFNWSSFHFLNVVFYYTIINETDFYDIKKYVSIANIFASKKCLCLVHDIQPTFPSV